MCPRVEGKTISFAMFQGLPKSSVAMGDIQLVIYPLHLFKQTNKTSHFARTKCASRAKKRPEIENNVYTAKL